MKCFYLSISTVKSEDILKWNEDEQPKIYRFENVLHLINDICDMIMKDMNKGNHLIK